MRKNIDNVMSEFIIACGVAVLIIAGLAYTAHQQRDIWAQQRASQNDTQAVESSLNAKTGN